MVINLIIYRTIKRKTFLNSPSAARTKREFYIATILILIVTLFGTCQILRCVINMLELVCVLSGGEIDKFMIHLILFSLERNLEQTLGKSENLVISLSHFLITFNCSANFAIYCYKVGITNIELYFKTY